jgi:GNAT superfamily N-acetyltransferase
MNDFSVQRATLADIDDLATLFDAYRVFYKKDSDIEGAHQFLLDRIRQNESVVYLCRMQGIATGFVQLYPLFSSTRMKRLWLLNDLYVSPEHRGQGMSKALIDAAKALAIETNACGLSLETDKNNLIGNHLYIKTQFELDNDHNYYFYTNKS